MERASAGRTTQRDHREIGGPVAIGGNVFLPKSLDNGFDQRGAAQQSRFAVTCGGELRLNARRFLRG